MKIEFTGTGTAFSKVEFTSNLLMSIGDSKWMIDFGITASKSLFEKNIFLSALNGVVITHLHADHIGGLEELALLSKLSYKNKPYIVSTPGLLDSLWNHSLRGGLEFIEENPGDERSMTLEDFFQPIQVEEGTWFTLPDFDGTKLKLVPSKHIRKMENYGVTIKQENGKQFFFSGDSRFDAEYVLKNGKDSDIIFHDCQLHDNGEDNAYGVHASLHQLKRLPKEIRKKMWLYHYATGAQLPDIEREFAGFVKRDMVFRI